MAKLKISSAQMVEQARAQITEIETNDLIARLDDPSVLIVDIRDIRERQRTGFIPHSFHAPRGMIEFWVDPQSPSVVKLRLSKQSASLKHNGKYSLYHFGQKFL